MSWFDDLKARVRPPVRTALLAACAERVLPVYEEYWVGDYSPSVARAVEIGWAFARGYEMDATELRTCLDEVQDLVTYYYGEATRHEILAAAVTVMLRLVQSLTSDDAASALATARGVGSTIDTAKGAESMANWDAPTGERQELARAEEKAWQGAALSRAETWTGAVTRAMFDGVGPKPPAWLLDWRARTGHLR